MAAARYRRFNALLQQTATRTDGFLTHLNRVLATSAGVEAVLCTLCYTLYFVHSRLIRFLEKRYERLALALATKASSALFPGETVVASIEPPRSRLSELCASTKSLADLVDDFRFFTRLWGLVTIYSWARDNYTSPPGDAALKILVWAQVGVSSVFQFLENGAYLASKGILRGERWEARQAKWFVLSNRFWLAHIMLEGLRLLRVRQLRYNEDFGAKTADEDSNVKAEGEVRVQSEELKRKWHSDFYANAGWLPLTLHWSFEDNAVVPISETWIGLFGILPGIVMLRDVWEQTREA
ncbi:hypothetical protein LTR56_016874 [Elasticomyces elasticus]|nr:hypothetical protein LTR56_016874 [Elasticomyces elasticus]KAK3658643.1 hypothetical protein LTR22_008815 [Elasticomyces elasticus]KAK4913566.1 hypothetical protein LTR49_018085 [Elasticomyces elasticus]KAK5756580.1 hypothetical protein LTS12_013296 [Elasticomyces elasticus]